MSIKKIAIIHHVHTDFGYTDHPCRTKIEHVKYINQAVDYVLASSDYPEGARFAWTQEQLYPVRMWWETATDIQKERFFKAIATGRLEITGTPFNVTAFMDKNEWECAMNWIDKDLWDSCNIKSAMQIDVNGMHTAGMVTAYEKGIRNLFIGPNSYYGAPPMPTPTAFNWQIDKDKQLFVWLNTAYNNGTFMFNENWRQGPVPNYSDLRYRMHEKGDIWASDDESIKKAHKMCIENIKLLEGNVAKSDKNTDGFTKYRVAGGYKSEILPVSVTGQWRFDNDPPFYPIVDFVKRWNELGLQPELLLCTATKAMEMMKEEFGDSIPTYSGEWIDWWANGNASSPNEMAYNREAKRTLKIAKSELFGPMSNEDLKTAREITENICLYDEHCFSSWQSVSNPYSFANVSQTAEKNIYVYRALDGAQCLLSERARAVTDKVKNKIVVFNTANKEKAITVELPLNCMRGEYHSVRYDKTGEILPIVYTDGVANFLRPSSPEEFGPENISHTFSDKCKKQGIKFGPVKIPANSQVYFTPLTQATENQPQTVIKYSFKADGNGWPQVIWFEGQSEPVISGSFGDFIAVRADGFSPRWTFRDIFDNDNPEERAELRKEHIFEVHANYGKTKVTKNFGNIRFEQPIFHNALLYGVRIINLDLMNSQVNFELRMNRKSDFSPEVLLLKFDAPQNDAYPYISNAGVKFRPEKDQLKGSCMDFYAIDGWIHYPNGWLFNSIDSALVTFGDNSVVSRKNETMGPINKIYVRLFDNLWDTNFCANANGMMVFRFNASANVPLELAESEAESMSTEPVVVVKSGYRE